MIEFLRMENFKMNEKRKEVFHRYKIDLLGVMIQRLCLGLHSKRTESINWLKSHVTKEKQETM